MVVALVDSGKGSDSGSSGRTSGAWQCSSGRSVVAAVRLVVVQWYYRFSVVVVGMVFVAVVVLAR